MPSDGRYMYPHPPPNMSYDYGAYPPNTYDNPQYPPNHPGAPQRPPHPVNAESLILSRVIRFHTNIFPSRHTRQITVRPLITSCNNNGQPVGRRILRCTTLLRQDNRHRSQWYLGRNRHRSRPHGKSTNNPLSNLRNLRTRNYNLRKTRCKWMAI